MEQLPARQQVGDAELEALVPGTVRQLQSRPPSGGYVEIGSAESGDEELTPWLQYWETLARHKRLIALAACVGLLLGLGVSLYQPPLYSTGATLEFNQVSQRQPFE